MMGQPQEQAQPLDEISITIGIDSIFQIIGIALLLSALAGLVAVSRITKYEPMKILMERN
jgi:putative ABC transport system permease protein